LPKIVRGETMAKSIGGLLVAFLAITAAVPARADLFNFTGSIQTFTVVTTGVYTIISAGTQGGSTSNATGSLGAAARGRVLLTAGTVLDIVVGRAGGDEPLVMAATPAATGEMATTPPAAADPTLIPLSSIPRPSRSPNRGRFRDHYAGFCRDVQTGMSRENR
jgi:hypothetical protein